tara:strand:+ start:6832 stop:7059 length:228 start_codon:yes stop_codon:yes gene_type:complete
MKRFRITYRHPTTDKLETTEADFEDCWVKSELLNESNPDLDVITAQEWANDYGYTLSDKGRILPNMIEVKNNGTI